MDQIYQHYNLNVQKFKTVINTTPKQFRNDGSGRYCDGYIFCKEGFKANGCGSKGNNPHARCVNTGGKRNRKSRRR